jgi:hypothetical protein
MRKIKLKISLVGQGKNNFSYLAEAVKEKGRYYYRVKSVEMEITEIDYNRVTSNPYLYYFSTALKLHHMIQSINKG